MRNIISKILPFIQWNKQEQSKKELLHNFVILPESIRYAMQYWEAQLWKEEINSLLHPSFWASGFYMMMKFYDNNPSIQLSILSKITEYYDNKSILYKELSHLHLEQDVSHTILWDKISTLSKYNFNGLDSKFDNITDRLNTNIQKPVILLYAGLLGLPSLLHSYQWDHIRLFNPKKPSTSFFIKKHWDQRNVTQENISNISDEYVFIDDMYNTGEAYNKALQSLSSLGYNNKLEIYSAVNTK